MVASSSGPQNDPSITIRKIERAFYKLYRNIPDIKDDETLVNIIDNLVIGEHGLIEFDTCMARLYPHTWGGATKYKPKNDILPNDVVLFIRDRIIIKNQFRPFMMIRETQIGNSGRAKLKFVLDEKSMTRFKEIKND